MMVSWREGGWGEVGEGSASKWWQDRLQMVKRRVETAIFTMPMLGVQTLLCDIINCMVATCDPMQDAVCNTGFCAAWAVCGIQAPVHGCP